MIPGEPYSHSYDLTDAARYRMTWLTDWIQNSDRESGALVNGGGIRTSLDCHRVELKGLTACELALD
jgi:hypothetical protein